jgi:hypothetical protein
LIQQKPEADKKRSGGGEYIWLSLIGDEHLLLDKAGSRVVRVYLTQLSFDDSFLGTGSLVDLVDIRDDTITDQARPELITARDFFFYDKKPLSMRRLRKSLRSVSLSTSSPPLWRHGLSTSYSLFDGSTPSVCVVHLENKVAIFKDGRDNKDHIGFKWNGVFQSYPLSETLRSKLKVEVVDRMISKKQIKLLLGFYPSFLVLAYTTPEEGYCKKLAVALL